MRAVLIALLLLVIMPCMGRALVVEPTYFEATIHDGGIYTDRFGITPDNLSSEIFIYPTSVFGIAYNKTYNLSWTGVDFTVSVPEYFVAGNYMSYFLIVEKAENDSFVVPVTLNITVPETQEFIVNIESNYTYYTGDSGFLDFNIKNIGNEPIAISTPAISNTSTFMDITAPQESIIIYPNLTVPYFLTYKIPIDVIPGIYDMNLTLSSDNYSTITPIKIVTKDNRKPTITKFEYENPSKAGVEYEFVVEVEDNIDVSEVTLEVDSLIDERIMFYDDDENLWSLGEITFEEIGLFNISVRVKDTSNNELKNKYELKIDRLEGISIYPVSFYQIKREQTILRKLFESEEKIDVNVTLRDFSFERTGASNASSFEIWVESRNKKHSLYIVDEDDAENVSSPTIELNTDEIYLGFRGEVEGYYSGRLIFTFNPWVSQYKELAIDGRVGKLNVPKDYNMTIGTARLECEAIIYDDERDSIFDCHTLYPIHTDLSGLGRFMTENEYNAINAKCDTDLEKEGGYTNQARAERDIFFWIVVILIIIGIVYYIFVIREVHFLIHW